MKTLASSYNDKSPERDLSGLDGYSVLVNIIGAQNISPSGEELIHSCPLPFGNHRNGDTNPSASLNTSTLLFNCFTCGGGDVVWLVSNVLGISRGDAYALLRGESDGTRLVPTEEFVDRLKGVFSKEQVKSEDVPVYSDTIIQRWVQACDYLTERGVSEQVQLDMRTGVDRNRIEIAKTPAGEQSVRVDRVVLPHFMEGKLIGWVARKIQNVEGVPKYRNSKGFPRGTWLYNMDNARQYDEVYVVESPMSVLVMKSRGINNVVATFGAKVEAKQIQLLRQFSGVTVYMDGDEAGRKSTRNLVNELSSYVKMRVISTPDGHDPATLEQVPESVGSLAWQIVYGSA
jgi:DNA primase